MTQDEIIVLAREAGLYEVAYPNPAGNNEAVERFATLVAEATKEKVYQAIRDAETPYTQLTLGQQDMIKEAIRSMK